MSLPDLPGLNLNEGEPAFAEPWQAQAFAMTVALHEQGNFGWDEWAATLSAQLDTDPTDDGSRYWTHWLAALEALMEAKGATDAAAIAAREKAWHDAAARTPHGEPIVL